MEAQPAKKSYFFDKGYRDLWNTIKGAWIRNTAAIIYHAEAIKGDPASNLGVRIFFGVVHVLALISIVVFGSAVTAAITLCNIAVLVVFMGIIYIGFSVAWAVDRLYLIKNNIFVPCDKCKESHVIPVYICPQCGAEHTMLTPSVYGILHRTCNCGQVLPTTFFNGRKDLQARCANKACRIELNAHEARPLCIPVIGGRSVGKTAYITAFSKCFIEQVAPSKGITTEFYNKDKEEIYNEIVQDYQSGATRMTARPTDPNVPSSVSFSFFAKHESLQPDRLIHIYDVAGEVFTDNDEHETPQHYKYCHGLVLIIDPFSIPTIRLKYEDALTEEDKAGIGTADINDIIDSFLGKLREVTGLSDKEMARMPIAVVLSKIDSAGLEEFIGDTAIQNLMDSDPETFSDYFDTQDYLCRKFLLENEYGGFLNNITIQFKNNRFFACSAIGHTRDQGEYAPKGVMAPIEWLFSMRDKKLAEICSDHVFEKKTLVERGISIEE